MPYRVDQAQILREGLPFGPGLVSRWAGYFLRPVTILRSWDRADVAPDLLAALTVAMVAMPQALAYASIANLPPHFGLYAAIVATIVGSLWGSSRHLSTGPTNAASILMLSILAPLVAVDSKAFLIASSVMAMLVGLFRLGFGLSGLGFLVNFVSRGVLLGFTAGAGALIAINQLRHLLGFELPRGTLAALAGAARQLDRIHGPSLAVGLGVIGLTLAINRFFRKLPGSLVALGAATAAVAWLGAERLGIRVVGDIPSAVPQLTDLSAAWSFLHQGAVGQMLTGALAVSLLGLVEAVSIARTIARSSGQRLDVNQEFVGQGLSNIAAGLFSGYPCSGSFTRSAVNYQAGARSALSGVYVGLLILAGTLVMAPFLGSLPRAALAGVIMLVAWGMIDRASIRRVLRTSRQESAVMGVTFAATLLFPLEFAVLSGVIFSLSMYVYASSLPRVRPAVPDPSYRHFVEAVDAPPCSQLGVMNITGSLFFGATQHVEEVLLRNRTEHPHQHYLLLRMQGVPDCDFTGIEMLEGIVRGYREAGGDVYLVEVRPAVRELMEHADFHLLLGEGHFLDQEEAVDLLFDAVIDPAHCWYGCPHQVAGACQAVPSQTDDVAIPPHEPSPVDPARLLELEQVEELLRTRSPLVIDVRERDEYRLGHLKGARNMPLRELLTRAEELPRDQPILFLCRAGRRSKRAVRMLLDLGYEDVQNLRGGVLSWKAAELPLEAG